MTRWMNLEDAHAVPERTRKWLALILQEPAADPTLRPKRKYKRSRKKPRAVEVIKGRYAPIWLACPNCGQPMIRQLDEWHCYCGHGLTHQHGIRYQIAEIDPNVPR